jgi:hypothetical protein
MMRQVRIAMISAAVAALGTTAAVAADPAGKKQRDPNEVVCEKQKELGSRLAVKRVCMTRAEWAERRRLDRMDLEKTQINQPMQGK